MFFFTGIKNLVGEPDYRQVRLLWEDDNDIQDGYQVKYCELQTWGTQKCRVQAVAPTSENDKIVDNFRLHSVDIKGLRMATTYSFEVKKAEGRKERAEEYKNQNIIVIPTKGCKSFLNLH